MNIPRNHHYVSQCQIKNFFNQKEGKIYLYDKVLNNFFDKATTKTVFSEQDGNSRFDHETGVVDHSSLESDLKNNFEDYFTSSFNQIKTALQSSSIITSDLQEPLINLTKYGLAGELRPPQFKQSIDQIMGKSLFENILPYAAPELRQELEALKDALSQTKYSNSVEYSKFVQEILQRMGEVYFQIYYITGDGLFILPDRPSFTHRAKINQYFNPDIQEIASVEIPLSSKIYLHVKSQKLEQGENQVYELTNEHQQFIEGLNLSMLHLCFKQVACESREYLDALVPKWVQLPKK